MRRLNILAVLGLIRLRNAVQAALTRLEWQSSGHVRRVILGSSTGQFGHKRSPSFMLNCLFLGNTSSKFPESDAYGPDMGLFTGTCTHYAICEMPLCRNIGVEETGTLAADQPSAVSCVAAAQTSHVDFPDVGSLCMPPQKVGRAVILGLEEGPPS